MTITKKSVKVLYSKRLEAELWCHYNIGPRKYYLHSGVGGLGWHIKNNNEIHVEKEEYLTMMLLKGLIDYG